MLHAFHETVRLMIFTHVRTKFRCSGKMTVTSTANIHVVEHVYMYEPLFSLHPDADVHVACLTCYGAIVSIQPPLEEVEVWMAKDERPWIVQHCCSILQTQSEYINRGNRRRESHFLPAEPLSLQTEALQVLTAVPKFYFQSIR